MADGRVASFFECHVRELVISQLEFLQAQSIDGLAASQSSTCGKRTDREFTFQVAIFIF